MNYQATIEYLFSRLPMFTRIGDKAYKKDLHNTLALCDAIGNPHQKFKTIHIAGTNGKGSTSNMLAAILQTAGYKTGLYTSPHIKDFRERIRVNGAMAKEQFVIDFTDRIMPHIERIQPSFFEVTVAMAFEYFAQQKVDVAVIETGLGGRLDSTNIITPVLSIITNIGYDHMNILGNRLEMIATEKAGIIKPGVPVVIGEYLPETKKIFENQAALGDSEVVFAQDRYCPSNISKSKFLECDITDRYNNTTERFRLDLKGIYQIQNLCTVLAAEGILMRDGFNISEKQEKYALENVATITGLRGRWEKIADNPAIILDVGHNEDGIKLILQQADADFPGVKKNFVLGFVKDKDVEKVLSLFPKDASYYFTNAHIPRAMSAHELTTLAQKKGLYGKSFDNVNDAISAAKETASLNDVIIVCGSFFTIAEID